MERAVREAVDSLGQRMHNNLSNRFADIRVQFSAFNTDGSLF